MEVARSDIFQSIMPCKLVEFPTAILGAIATTCCGIQCLWKNTFMCAMADVTVQANEADQGSGKPGATGIEKTRQK